MSYSADRKARGTAGPGLDPQLAQWLEKSKQDQLLSFQVSSVAPVSRRRGDNKTVLYLTTHSEVATYIHLLVASQSVSLVDPSWVRG